jgi:hypothetical protein
MQVALQRLEVIQQLYYLHPSGLGDEDNRLLARGGLALVNALRV